MHNMKLVEGDGNAFVDRKPLEDDKVNTVYVVVSQLMHFHMDACSAQQPSMLDSFSACICPTQ